MLKFLVSIHFLYAIFFHGTTLHAQVQVGFDAGLSRMPFSVDGVYGDDLTDFRSSSWSMMYGIFGEMWLDHRWKIRAKVGVTKREQLDVVISTGFDSYDISRYIQVDMAFSLFAIYQTNQRVGLGLGLFYLNRFLHWEELVYSFDPDVYYDPKSYIMPTAMVSYSFNRIDCALIYSRSLRASSYAIGASDIPDLDRQTVYQPEKNFFDFRISIPFTRSADELRLGKSKR